MDHGSPPQRDVSTARKGIKFEAVQYSRTKHPHKYEQELP
jgi:hypothetical protein